MNGPIRNKRTKITCRKFLFVIPCYRSEHTLAAVHEELTATMQTLPQYDYEVVLINDCSPDDTIGTIRRLVAADAHVQGVDLAKKLRPARRADGWFPSVYR